MAIYDEVLKPSKETSQKTLDQHGSNSRKKASEYLNGGMCRDYQRKMATCAKQQC
jgi:hypothetical protein